MSIFTILIGFCIFGSTLANMFGSGPCPSIKTMPNFDMAKYLGKWYVSLVLLIPNQPIKDKCPFDEYTMESNDTNGTIINVYTKISRVDGSKKSSPRICLIPDPAEPGKTILSPLGGNITVEQDILETDYDNFSLIYTCANVNGDHSIQSIVYTRDQNPSELVTEKIVQAIEKHNLPKGGFRRAKQDDCVMRPDEDFHYSIKSRTIFE